jgi:hypothetical protein
MMRANLEVILASIGTAALLACPAVAGTVWYPYYAPHPYYYYYYAPGAYGYGYRYFGHHPPYYYSRGGGNPNWHLGSCVRRAFQQCSD